MFYSIVNVYTSLWFARQLSALQIIVTMRVIVVDGVYDRLDARTAIVNVAVELVRQSFPSDIVALVAGFNEYELRGVGFAVPVLQWNEVSAERWDESFAVCLGVVADNLPYAIIVESEGMEGASLFVADAVEGASPPTIQVVAVSPCIHAGVDDALLDILIGHSPQFHLVGAEVDSAVFDNHQIRCASHEHWSRVNEDKFVVVGDVHQMTTILLERLTVVGKVGQRHISNTPEESRVVLAAVDMGIFFGICSCIITVAGSFLSLQERWRSRTSTLYSQYSPLSNHRPQ